MKTEDNIPSKAIGWIVSGAFFMQMIDSTILNTALPAIARDIGHDPLEIQSIVIAYILTIAALLPLSGWIADYLGAKKVFLWAVGVFTLGSLFCALSSTLPVLIISRIIQGAGGAFLTSTGRLVAIKLYPKNQLVKVFSLIMLPASLGPVMGPPLGGFIVEYLSWQWIFFVNIPIGILLMWLTHKKMPHIEREARGRFDWSGFIMLSTAVIIICTVSNQSGFVVLSLASKMFLFWASALLLYLLGEHLKVSRRPLFNKEIFKIKTFVIGIFGGLGARLGFGAMPFLIPLMLQLGLKISPSRSGIILFALGISTIFGRMMADKMVSMMGYRKMLTLNTIIIGIIIAAFFFVGANTSEAVLMILLILLGMFNSPQFSAMSAITLVDIPKKYASDANTLLSIVVQVAMALAINLGSSILDFGRDALGIDRVLDAFQITFLVLGLITILSSVAFVFIPKNMNNEEVK